MSVSVSMVKIWALGNSDIFTKVAASQSHVITICNLPRRLQISKANLGGEGGEPDSFNDCDVSLNNCFKKVCNIRHLMTALLRDRSSSPRLPVLLNCSFLKLCEM